VDLSEADPQALERTAERLFLIGDLKRKYGESIREVLTYASEARQRLGEIEHRSERLAELAAYADELQVELGAAVAALSSRRQKAAREFSTAVERELADLRLAVALLLIAVYLLVWEIALRLIELA